MLKRIQAKNPNFILGARLFTGLKLVLLIILKKIGETFANVAE